MSKTPIDTNKLFKRLQEIKEQITILIDERDTIELQLLENHKNKKICLGEGNNKNEQNKRNFNISSSSNNDNSQSIMDLEERQSESKNLLNNSNPVQKDKQPFDDDDMKNYDKLKDFFESTWDVNFLDDYQLPKQDGPTSDREIAAYKKLNYFISESFIEDYEAIIYNASLKKEDFDLPPDKLKPLFENLLNAIVIRSKVLELFDNCAKEAGSLYQLVCGVSLLQVQSEGTHELQGQIYCLLYNQQYFTWSFEKLKALLQFWQGCVVCGSYIEYIVENSDFDGFYNSLLTLLDEQKLTLTEQERDILQSILTVGKNFCKKR